jgi:hypothetical protein
LTDAQRLRTLLDDDDVDVDDDVIEADEEMKADLVISTDVRGVVSVDGDIVE